MSSPFLQALRRRDRGGDLRPRAKGETCVQTNQLACRGSEAVHA